MPVRQSVCVTRRFCWIILKRFLLFVSDGVVISHSFTLGVTPPAPETHSQFKVSLFCVHIVHRQTLGRPGI